MTPKELKELGIQAVKTFPELFPDAWKHDWAECGDYVRCEKCNVRLGSVLVNDPCTVPTPITIDDSAECLGKAMEVFRRFIDSENMPVALRKLTPKGYDPLGWVACFATPQQIWRICLLAAKETE